MQETMARLDKNLPRIMAEDEERLDKMKVRFKFGEGVQESADNDSILD